MRERDTDNDEAQRIYSNITNKLSPKESKLLDFDINVSHVEKAVESIQLVNSITL